MRRRIGGGASGRSATAGAQRRSCRPLSPLPPPSPAPHRLGVLAQHPVGGLAGVGGLRGGVGGGAGGVSGGRARHSTKKDGTSKKTTRGRAGSPDESLAGFFPGLLAHSGRQRPLTTPPAHSACISSSGRPHPCKWGWPDGGETPPFCGRRRITSVRSRSRARSSPCIDPRTESLSPLPGGVWRPRPRRRASGVATCAGYSLG